MRLSGGSSLKETSRAIFASVFTWNDLVLLITMSLIFKLLKEHLEGQMTLPSTEEELQQHLERNKS